MANVALLAIAIIGQNEVMCELLDKIRYIST